MRKKNPEIKILAVIFTCLLLNISLGDNNPVGRTVATELGTYNTEKIQAALEHTIKYKQPPKGDQVEMVFEFLELNKELFRVKNPREELVLKYRNERVISFQQTYKGVGLPSGVKARFSRNGELTSVEGNYIYDINLPTTPTVDSATAARISLQDAGNPPKARVEGPKGLAIVSPYSIKGYGPDRLYLVWTLKVFPRDDVNPLIHWVYYVNALDGTIVHKQKELGVFIEPNKK